MNKRVLVALVLLGAALRVWQWGAEGSLWLDEIAIARNVEARSIAELVTQPLAFDQVAPPGFLAVVKSSTMAFGNNERALWLFSLLWGLVGLALFAWLASRILRGFAVVIAVTLFAVALPLIRYSAEVKQYGIDAAVAVGLTLLAFDLRQRDRPVGRLLLAGSVGLIVIWFSQSSAIVMAALGVALAVMWLIERDARTGRALLITVPLWAIASALAVWMGNRSMTPSTRAFMEDFWRGGFVPLPLRITTAAPWSWERFVSLFGDNWTLRYPLPWIFALLAILGVLVLWFQRRDVALFVAAPIVITMIAAMAQQYPFRQRLIVFLVPTALVAAAAGAGWIADLAAKRSAVAAVAISIATMIIPLVALAKSGLPARVDHYRSVYAHLKANRRPGDAVYVMFLGNSSAIYYGPRYGLARNEYHLGICDRDDTRAYLRDVDRFRGRQRLWMFYRSGPAYRVPREAMRQYLDTIGVEHDSLSVASQVSEPMFLVLYDLSDPARLRAASAETFPVPEMPAYPKPGCRDWSGDARAEHPRVSSKE